jgi:hypothetical protein
MAQLAHFLKPGNVQVRQYVHHLKGVEGRGLMGRNMFPGLGTAIVAFTAYVVYDDFIAKKEPHGHGHGDKAH